jgi:hypothetical protein
MRVTPNHLKVAYRSTGNSNNPHHHPTDLTNESSTISPEILENPTSQGPSAAMRRRMPEQWPDSLYIPAIAEPISDLTATPRNITQSDGTVSEVRIVSPEQQALDNAEAAKTSGKTSELAPPKPEEYNFVD